MDCVIISSISLVIRSLKLPAIGAVSVQNIFSMVVCLLSVYSTAGYYEMPTSFLLEGGKLFLMFLCSI